MGSNLKQELLDLIEEVKARQSTSKVLLRYPDAPVLHESSLSRVYTHIENHDCAILTAFRNDPLDTAACSGAPESPHVGTENAAALNKLRNRDLKATLLAMKYGVTRVDGSYIEDFETPEAIEVAEESYFVVNLNNSPEFFLKIALLGQKFCQDSVLLIPHGGKRARLVGTNLSEFPGLNNEVDVGDLRMGGEAEFMSRVGRRPFTFNEGLTTYKSLSRNERMAVKSIAKKVLKNGRPSSKN